MWSSSKVRIISFWEARLRVEGQDYTRPLGFAAELCCGPSGYCLVTWMLLALQATVNPAVWLVNDPLIEPAVRAV